MSRNGSGIYSLPAVYDVSDGDTSAAAQITTPFEDLETDANTARPIVAGGTGATTAAAARTNLSVYSKTETDTAITDNLSGPATSVDGNFASFNGTTGAIIKDSGKSSASFATAAQGTKADSATQATDLASTSASKGASLVGIQDSGGLITATTVEAALAELATSISNSLGIGQTWQNVAASRAVNTAYQNTTGKPIQVAVSATGTGSGTRGFYVSADGVTYVRVGKWTDSNNPATITAVIPDDHYYKTDTGPTIDAWTELR